MQANTDGLSERELEILRLVATGASNKEIARDLYISPNTVKVHLRNIFSKIQAASRTEAAIYAVNAGLVPSVSSTIETLSESVENELRTTPQTDGGWLSNSLSTNRGLMLGIITLLFVVVSLSIFFYWWRSSRNPTVFPQDVQTTWQELASVPTARTGFGVVAFENKIYTLAGETESEVSNLVEIYDPLSNSWETGSLKPTAVTDVSAVAIGGEIYIPGGRLETGEPTDVLEIYNPLLDLWESGANLPHSVSAYGLVAFEGKVFLFGGLDGSRYMTSVFEYDPLLDTWSERTPLPSSRAYMGCVVAGDRIYLIGGFDGKIALQANDVYLPHADRQGDNPWMEAKPLPGGLYKMGVASLVDAIYVIGGVADEENEVLSQLRYVPSQDHWEINELLSSGPWSQVGIAVLGSHLHLIGGVQDNVLTNNHYAFQALYLVHMPVIR